MTNVKLTLSVILTNYNDSHLIGGALDAICNQSYSPYEVIVVDDGSTDNSLSVIEEAATKYSCIRLVVNEKNQGVHYSVRRGLQAARGDIVTFTACDDRVRPGLFEAGMSLLAQYPQAAIFSSDIRTHCPAYNWSYDSRQGWLDHPGYVSPQDLAAKLNGGGIHTNTVMIKREVVSKMVLYPQQLKWHGDWWTFHVIAFRHGICYTPEILGDYTFDHNASYSRGMYDTHAQTKVLLETARLACNDEHKDVLSLIIASRIFAPHFLRVATTQVILKILWRERCSKAARCLAGHLILEKMRQPLSALRSAFTITITPPSFSFNFLSQLRHLPLVNQMYYGIKARLYDIYYMGYRTYFHSYHAYAKARNLLRASSR